MLFFSKGRTADSFLSFLLEKFLLKLQVLIGVKEYHHLIKQ
jgi:hypothetical protein